VENATSASSDGIFAFLSLQSPKDPTFIHRGNLPLQPTGWRPAACNFEIIKMGDYTSFLFARPSFFEGMARAFDLGDTLTEYNRSRSGAEADETALYCDWMALAQDACIASRRIPEAKSEPQQSKTRN
jgi:hypothetical protein